MPSDFEQNLEKYAELAVRIGLNVQPGQRVLIRAPVPTAALVRQVAAQAYQAGARFVEVLWSDEGVDLARFRYAPRDSFEEFSTSYGPALLEAVERGDAIVSISADNPDLLKDQDPALVAAAQKTRAARLRPALERLSANATSWLVLGAPTAAWAAKVFPGAPAEEQVDRLWEAIFAICRADQADPIAAWREHLRRLTAAKDYLNHKRYTPLHYTAPGTDLTIGLPRGHVWASGGGVSENGIRFIPNIPTEEVFTLADAPRTSGVVTATRPLNHYGALVDNFRLTFAEGRVVDLSAGTGESVLRSLIGTDAGAARLGEVALVPHSSPIAKSGLLFYNTLFDENAASHIALGRAYRFNLEGGQAMSDEAFEQAGGNQSLIHVDFMIGSGQMDIDGTRDDGTTEPVMRGGEWAFDT
jgi:aminopeptidase